MTLRIRAATGPFPRYYVPLALFLSLCSIRAVQGQFQVTAVAAVEVKTTFLSDEEPVSTGFLLQEQPTEVKEALGDFAKYAERKQWDKAFAGLEKVRNADASKLLRGKDGFRLPPGNLVRSLVASLPAAGKEAYRLLSDSAAKKLMDEAKGKPEQANLQKVFDQYFATTGAAAAIDRLGDLHFQEGRLSQAVECWQALLKYDRASIDRPVWLQVKSAIALAELGRWEEFQTIRQSIDDQYGAEKVRLGGKEVSAKDHLASLAKGRGETPTVVDGIRGDIELPSTTEPLWQFRFLSDPAAQALASVGQNWGWGALPVTRMVPPANVDNQRVYLNVLGHYFAVSLDTGKLVWRTAPLAGLGGKLQNQPYIFAEQYTLSSSEDRLWSTTRPVAQLGQYNPTFEIQCIDKGTGKTLWNTTKVGGFNGWTFVGIPLKTADKVYALAISTQEGKTVHLYALDPATGQKLWVKQLGVFGHSYRDTYYTQSPTPLMLEDNGKLYLQTHAGTLIQLDAKTGDIHWGFQYESASIDPNQWNSRPTGNITCGPMILKDGVLYVKGCRSRRLYAVNVSEPSLLWQRPISESAFLVDVDEDQILLSGGEITSLDRKTRAMKWSTTLPVSTGWTRPAVTASRVYQFTGRGVFEVDRKSGDVVRIFRGSDTNSVGGGVYILSNSLITVSNRAVTAYGLGAQPTPGTTPAKTAAKNPDKESK